ncbi:hypothetical protein D3C78_1108090 [compost metagenome]
MVGGLGEHAPHQIQAIVAAGQAHGRLVVELGRHVGEVLGIDIGRVGDDQVEALPRQAVEAVALHGIHALLHLVTLDVEVGHLQRVERQVGEHHLRLGEGVGAGDADAAGAGAQVEDARRRALEPGREVAFDQLGDRRARHQHALVDAVRLAAEPGLAEQVGGRDAFVDTPLQQRAHRLQLVQLETAVEVVGRHIPGQMQAAQHQRSRLVPGVVGAVPEEQLGAMEAADTPADQVTDALQTAVVGAHGRVPR